MNSNHGQDQDDPFPLHRLPLEVREVVENLNFRTEIPIPAIALVVFGALSVATQERIRIRKRESLISPVTLWMLVALGSGERKTTLLNEVMKMKTKKKQKMLSMSFRRVSSSTEPRNEKLRG